MNVKSVKSSLKKGGANSDPSSGEDNAPDEKDEYGPVEDFYPLSDPEKNSFTKDVRDHQIVDEFYENLEADMR
eukprot:CAMPEP_0170482832 /NCGR_PEP_ID=MMETSP0208-20121228/2672_1 /TAXON_ID=197538 /ORGANISM="Strombidium inclinatum, Strain S3" /LENGTH=72 /DNA_ID=CAMNT_0010755707 /DNA_START=726 /DNA_END=944 /DNA_ORIENTATION=+